MITERAVSIDAAAPAWPLLPDGKAHTFERDDVTGRIEERTYDTPAGTGRILLAIVDQGGARAGSPAVRAAVEEAALRPGDRFLIRSDAGYRASFDEALTGATGDHVTTTVIMTDAEAEEALTSGRYRTGADTPHRAITDALPGWRTFEWVTSARHMARSLPEMTSETRTTDDGHTVVYARTEGLLTEHAATAVREKIAPTLTAGDHLVIEARHFGPNVGPAIAAAMPADVAVVVVWNPEVDTLPVNWTRAVAL